MGGSTSSTDNDVYVGREIFSKLNQLLRYIFVVACGGYAQHDGFGVALPRACLQVQQGRVGTQEDNSEPVQCNDRRGHMQPEEMLFAGKRRKEYVGAAGFIAEGSPTRCKEIVDSLAGEMLVENLDFPFHPGATKSLHKGDELFGDESLQAELRRT